MNQQQHEMYYDYPSQANRSPGSTRQGYATVGLGSGLQGYRGQRPGLDAMNGPLGSSALYSSEDGLRSGAGYNAHNRYDRLNPNGMQSSHMMDNDQTWAYNGAVATLNGPLNGNHRLGGRNVRGRAALPQVGPPFPPGESRRNEY